MANLEVMTFYDINCDYCNTSYSVDEELVTKEECKQSLMENAKDKGWRNTKQYGNLCPHCAKELNVK